MLGAAPKSDGVVVAAPVVLAVDEPKLPKTGAVEADDAVVDGAEVKLVPNEKPLLVAGADDEDELLTVEVAAVAAEGRANEKEGTVEEEAAEVDSEDDEDDELRLEPNERPFPNRPPLDGAPVAAAAGAAVETVEPSVPNEKLGREAAAEEEEVVVLVDGAAEPNENAGTDDEEAAEDDWEDVVPNSGRERYIQHPDSKHINDSEYRITAVLQACHCDNVADRGRCSGSERLGAPKRECGRAGIGGGSSRRTERESRSSRGGRCSS